MHASRPRSSSETWIAEPLEPRLFLSSSRFAVIGDFSAGQPEQDVATLVKSWSPSFVVTVGDNNYPAGAASTIDANVGQYYHQYLYPYSGTYGAGSTDGANHFWPALGNHDWMASNAQPYLDYFTLPKNERYYDVTLGNVGIFVIDSDPHEPDGNTAGSVQGAWLKDRLAASTAKWKLVLAHHPPYSSGSMGGSTWMRWPFQQWGATAMFAGHEHDYERLSDNGFPYFVDGLGGEDIVGWGSTDARSQVRYNSDFGAMLIDASDTAVTFQFYSRRGSLIDSFTVGAPTSPAAPSALTAVAASTSQIDLAWSDNSTNETGFKIERSTDNLHFAQIGTVASNVKAYHDVGLYAGTQYFYRVRAANAGGDSAYTNTTVATTLFGTTFIAAGSSWKYLDNGTNQSTSWRAVSFNDSTWKSGRAQLGYGDGDEATLVGYGPQSGSKYVTTYFRQAFTLTDPAAVSALTLGLVRDDGAVVYLNGTEVYRNNMPSGTIAYTTLASATVGDADESDWYSAAVDKSLLRAGTNVVAVEIHQSDRASSDISFDCRLAGSTAAAATPPAPSTLTAVALSLTQVNLAWVDNSTTETSFKIERSTNGVDFTQIGTVGVNVATYSDTTASGGLTYAYRVRATNAAGDSPYSNVASATPITLPAAPTGLAASVLLGIKVQLSWSDNSANEASFKVERSTDGVNFVQIGLADDNINTYLDITVGPGATYTYRVRATNPAGDSVYSNSIAVVVPSVTPSLYLSDLAWVSASSGWGPVERDQSIGGPNANDGTPITLNGVAYAKGLGTHSNSEIVYQLGGKYTTFLTDIGLDDKQLYNGSVVFEVVADGRSLFKSGVMRPDTPTITLNLDITGVQQLKLIVTDGGDGIDFDHADWAGARVR